MSIFQLELWQIALLFSPLLFIFWTLLNIQSRDFPSVQEKYYWLVFCSLVPILGSLIYLVFGLKRSTKIAK